MTVIRDDWGKAFLSAWNVFHNPREALKPVFPIPDDATPAELAAAWRVAVGEKHPQHVIAAVKSSDREDPTVSTLEQLYERISTLAGSDEASGLILVRDFGSQEFSTITCPDDNEYTGPGDGKCFIAAISRLPVEHFLRSLPNDFYWKNREGSPCLILPPDISCERHRSFYLWETVERYTTAYSGFQKRKAAQYKAYLEHQALAEKRAREADPLYRAQRLENENSELRQRLEALERKLNTL